MKLRRFLAAVCLLGSVLLGVEWSEPERISPDTHSPVACDLCVDSQGRPWLFVGSGYVTFFDGGWQEPMEVDFGLGWNGGFARISIDKEDVVWVSVGEACTRIYYRRYDGEEWSELNTVPVYPCANFFPNMTADSSGGVWFAWDTDWWWWWGWQIVYNRYTDGSWDWDEPQLLTDTSEVVDHEIYSMTTDAYGHVWIGWKDTGIDPMWKSVKASYYDGNSWSEEMVIFVQDSMSTGNLDLAPDREGGMWALWECTENTFDPKPNFLLASHWDGETWSLPDTVAISYRFYELDNLRGKIAVDEHGNAWAVWRQALVPSDTFGDIYYSVNTGSGWSEPGSVSEHPAVDERPGIIVDGSGRVWCVWTSNREGPNKWDYRAYASYFVGSGVEEPVTPVTQHLPSLTIDKSVGGEFTFSVSHSNIVRGIVIYDASGSVVRDLTISDNQTIHWDGTDAKGQALSPGVYFVKLSPTSSTLKLILIR